MWIEIFCMTISARWKKSHPLCEDVDWNLTEGDKAAEKSRSSSMRGCGLKWSMSKGSITYLSSSSSWGCGLKFWHSYAVWLFLFVILLARRWIEISLSVSFLLMTFGHPPCEGEGALLIIFTSKAYKKTPVWVYSIIMLYTAGIS